MKNRLLLFELSLLLFFGLFLGGKESLAAPRDLVVVIDKSVSMLDEFDKVKAEAETFVGSAQRGDRITVITFGTSAQLLERTRIKSAYDMASVISAIHEVQPTDFATNLGAGMERSLDELQRLYKNNAENERVVLWLSDGKENPPKNIDNLITFASLKEKESERLPEKEWFAFQSPIPHRQSDVEWFVDWANRREMHLHASLIGENSKQSAVPGPERYVRVRFEPDTPAVQGVSFSVTAEAADVDGPARFVPVRVAPERIVCRKATWDTSLRVEFPAAPGKYLCRISFVLPSDQTLKISPLQVNVKGTVLPRIETAKHSPQAIRPALADAVATSTGKETASGSLRGMGHAALLSDPHQGTSDILAFGPISAGSQYVREIKLSSSQNIDPHTLSLVANLQLPDGLELHPAFHTSSSGVSAQLRLVASKDLDIADDWQAMGVVRIVSETGDIDPTQIPVRLFAGKQEMGVRRIAARYLAGWTRDLISLVKSNAALLMKAILVFLALWSMAFCVKRFVFGGAGLAGFLEPADADSEKLTKPVNLRRVGRLKGRSFLTMGSGKEADIIFRDDSIADLHAQISAQSTPAGTLLFLEPLCRLPLTVNGIQCTHARELGNGDVVALGGLSFTYRCAESFKETILCFRDGRFIRGMLISWDMESPLFEFLPKGAPSLDARMAIEFSELKWLAFIGNKKAIMLGARKKKGPHAGRGAEIIFKDGDVMEGYLIGDLIELGKRFYLIPRTQSERALYMVEKSAIQNTFLRDFENPQAGDFLKSLSARIGLQRD